MHFLWFCLELIVVLLLSTAVTYTMLIWMIVLWNFNLWNWEVLLLAILLSRHLSRFIMRAIMVLLTMVLRSYNRWVYALHVLEWNARFSTTWVIVFLPLLVLFSDQAKSRVHIFMIDAILSATILLVISLVMCLILNSFSSWF